MGVWGMKFYFSCVFSDFLSFSFLSLFVFFGFSFCSFVVFLVVVAIRGVDIVEDSEVGAVVRCVAIVGFSAGDADDFLLGGVINSDELLCLLVSIFAVGGPLGLVTVVTVVAGV
jgi:hypothetical protein